MSLPAQRSPLLLLFTAAATQIGRRPYLSMSVLVHAAVLGLLYGFGSYEQDSRQRAAEEMEVASSLRATGAVSTAKRLQDLQTIKQLMEKSADMELEPSPAMATPQTPQEMVEQARELSKAIDALDKEIKADELAQLTGVPKPPPATEPPPVAAPQAPERNEGGMPAKSMQEVGAKASEAQAAAGKADGSAQASTTQDMADSEVAALEAKARATLAKRQQRLEAKANGVPVEGKNAGAGESGEDAAGKPSGRPGKERGTDASVQAEIADFIGGDERKDKAMRSRSYAGGSTQIFDRGQGQIPPVDAGSLVRGHGRMLGAGGEYANRVYLNSWYVIGPFAGRHGAGMFDNPAYPPEKAVLLDAVYYGKDKRLLKWRYVTEPRYPFEPPDQVEDSVYYGYTEVFVDEACDLTAWIGADDDVQVYLNDRMVWKGGNVNKATYFDAIFNRDAGYLRDYNRTEGKRVLHFNKGRNKLFFKLSNGPNRAFLSMVLTR